MDINPDTFEAARSAGASRCFTELAALDGIGPDAVVDFAGVGTTTSDATDVVRRRGRVVLVGLGARTTSLRGGSLVRKSVELRGSYGASKDEFRQVLGFIARGRIEPVVEEIPFADLNEGLDRIRRGGVRGRLVTGPLNCRRAREAALRCGRPSTNGCASRPSSLKKDTRDPYQCPVSSGGPPRRTAHLQRLQVCRETRPEPREREFLVRVDYLSLDPAMRSWMNEGRSYVPPVGLGEVMRAAGMGHVVESRHPGYRVGQVLSGYFGVQRYALSDGSDVAPVDLSLGEAPVHLGALGLQRNRGLERQRPHRQGRPCPRALP